LEEKVALVELTKGKGLKVVLLVELAVFVAKPNGLVINSWASNAVPSARGGSGQHKHGGKEARVGRLLTVQ
jgi:hypothetical protein